MNYKKLFAFLILGVFLLAFTPLTSATLKDYDTNKRIVSLDKSFLGIRTGSIADVQLITPLNYKVGLGYQKVAEMRVSGFTDYEDFITRIEFYNVADGMRELVVDYDLRKKELEQYIVNDYMEECSINITTNNETCYNVISGNHIEERFVWNELLEVNFNEYENLTLGLFTYVNEGDRVEWIPSFTKNNVRVEEWAVWTASLNTDLASYYKMEDIDSSITDSHGSNTGTYNGALYSQTGKIDNSIGYDGSNDMIDLNSNFGLGGTTDVSIFAWINADSLSTWKGIIAKEVNDADDFTMHTSSGRLVINIGSATALESVASMSTNTWYHVGFTYDGVDINAYINDVEVATTTYTGNFPTGNLAIGQERSISGRYFDGEIDEVGIWNRALTSAEITQLYNGGTGITYTNVFGTDPIVTPIEPNNGIVFNTIGNHDFTCYGSDAENFTDMEFYIDGVLEQTDSSGLNNTNYTFTQSLSEGDFNWTCIGYDDEANTGTFTARNFSVDTTPFIEITNPTTGEEIMVDSVAVNVTLTETYFDELIINLNYTNGTLADTITITDLTRGHIFEGVGDGNYNIEAIINTNTSKTNSSSVAFLVHTTVPQIDITSPTGTIPFIKIGNNETLNYSISEIGQNISHFDQCWFEYNDTEVLNNISSSGSGDLVEWGFASNYVNVTSITVNQQGNIETSSNIPQDCYDQRNFSLSVQVSGFTTTASCRDSAEVLQVIDSWSGFLDLTSANITANQKRNLNCSETNIEFEYALDNNFMCVHAIDEFGLHSHNTTTWEYSVIEKLTTFANTTTEGSTENFSVGLSLSPGVLISAATLHYGSMEYPASISNVDTDFVIFNNNLVIPNVDNDTNVTFFYELLLGDSSIINTTSNVQEVASIQIDDCSSFTFPIFTLSLKDEETRLNLTGNLDTSITISPQGNGIIVNSFFSEFTSVQTKTFCSDINLTETNLILDATLRYSATNYIPEFYHIQKANLGTYPKTIELYDIPENDSTEFKVIYQDATLLPVPGAVIQLQRQEFENGEYLLVEAPLTSSESTALIHVNVNANKYRVTVVKDGFTLGVFDDLVFKCESELTGECNLNLLTDIDPQNLVPIQNLIDFSYSITTVNNTITTTFSVPSGSPEEIHVKLVQKKITGTTTVCDKTVSSAAGSLSCDFDDSIEESSLTLKIYKNDELLAERGYALQEDLTSSFGGNNFFIVLILMLSLIGMAITSPEWMIIISVIGLLLAGGLWLLNGMNLVAGLGALVWLVIAAVILITKISKQDDQ